MKPLDGIRVVDLSHAISGPTCTQMLVQLGAEVIKVEPPVRGDDFRHYTEHAGLPGMSIPFAAINAGKRSLTLDLKSEEGREALWRLIDRATSWSKISGPACSRGWAFPSRPSPRRNPRLVAVSITGFGQSGPLKDWGAYDHIAQAMSGIALMNAGPEGPAQDRHADHRLIQRLSCGYRPARSAAHPRRDGQGRVMSMSPCSTRR